jgi:hypothetical protein
VQTARNTAIWLGHSFYLNSQSVWNTNETIKIGRIVIKCNCITIRIGKCLCAVCLVVFGLKQKDASSLFVFNSASVHAIKEAPAKPEGLEFNAT